MRIGASQRKLLATIVAAAALLCPGPFPLLSAQPAAMMAADGASFRLDKSERQFSWGLKAISERALEQVSLRTIALNGLQGLSTLDRNLTVSLQGGWLTLADGDHTLATIRLPADEDDPAGWGSVMARLIEGGRKTSAALAGTGDEGLYEVIFDAMLAPLDPFSRYAGADEARSNQENRNGFGGIGIRYDIETTHLRIQEVLPETPAAAAGLTAGDQVTRIDGVEIASLGNAREAIRDKLRGPVDSPLRLTVLRTRGEREILLHRGLVVPRTVSREGSEGGVTVIKVSSFNQNTGKSLTEVIEQVKQSQGASLRGIILDLRGNPGGLLDQAVSISDLFLNQGRIVFTRGRHPESMQSYSAGSGDILNGLPMAVLLDGRSASAAEIVGAALQDNGRAVVIGSSSYGKGTVQTVLKMPNGGELTLTWSRFHSPSGYALHGLGVMPVVCISDPAASATQTVSDALDNSQALSRRMNEWRGAPVWDNALHNRLRNSCPPQEEQDWAADVNAARALLSSPSLYHRAVSVARQDVPRRY